MDVANPSLDRPPIYARPGVREVRCYAGGRMQTLTPDRAGGGYEASPESRVLPLLRTPGLRRLVAEGLTSDRPGWVRGVRRWARDRRNRP